MKQLPTSNESMTWFSPVCGASRCSCVFQYRCSHFTLCCTSICIQPTLQSSETTLMSNITSLALIEESTATPFPLLCHHGSSLSEDTPPLTFTGLSRLQSESQHRWRRREHLFIHTKKRNNIRLHPDCTLWRPPLSNYTHNYIHRE